MEKSIEDSKLNKKQECSKDNINNETNINNIEKSEASLETKNKEEIPENKLNQNEKKFFKEEEKSDNIKETKKEDSIKEDEFEEEFNFEKALKLKEIGKKLFFERKYLESSEKFEESLAFCPPEEVSDKVKLLSNLSICMMKLEQYQNAVGYCNDALELDENWSKARYNRAESCFKLKRYDKALEDLKRVFKERPDLRNDQMMMVI